MTESLGDQEAVAAEGAKARVVWARDERGRLPAREFVQGLPQSDQAKIEALLRRFADHGAIHNTEKFRELKGEDLCELKIWGVRWLGRFVDENTFMVSHAVKKKKSSSLPSSDFKRARRLLEVNADRYSGVPKDATN